MRPEIKEEITKQESILKDLLLQDIKEKMVCNDKRKVIYLSSNFIKSYIKSSKDINLICIEEIIYDPSWSEDLYYRTSDRSYIENGIYCLKLKDKPYNTILELSGILNRHFDFNEYNELYQVYELIQNSDLSNYIKVKSRRLLFETSI